MLWFRQSAAMKSTSFQLFLRLLTLITISAVVVIGVSPFFNSNTFTLKLASFHERGPTVVSRKNDRTFSKIMGNRTDNRQENHLKPQQLPLEAKIIWKDFKAAEITKSPTDDRTLLELENYRYLLHPEILNRTFNVWRAQRLRSKVLRETCNRLQRRRLDTLTAPGHLLVDDRNRLIFCEVRKVSSITWRRVLDALAATNATGGRTGGLRRLDTYSARQRERRLRNYTKFMFVREPMLRLVSGWRDKFVSGPQTRDYQDSWGPRIRRYSDLKNENQSLIMSEGQDKRASSSTEDVSRLNISFVEFVRYMTAGAGSSPLLRDMHWEPYHTRCRPCRVRYDFVGHYETLGPDAAAFLARWRGGGRSVAFPAGRSASVTAARQEFPKLAPEDISRLAKLYDVDYNLFGYSMDRFMSWLQ